MWTRPDTIVLKLCKYGYCIYTQEPFDMNELGSLGMGWAYLIIPVVIGIVIGFIIGYFTKKMRGKSNE